MTAAAQARCPKCSCARAPAAEACARCGLVFALWTPDKANPFEQLDGAGAALWAEVEGAWADEARHDVFVKHCSGRGLLAAAGRQYRLRLDRDPADPVALRMRDRIVSMATASFRVPPRSPLVTGPLSGRRWFWAVVMLGAAAGVAGGIMFGR